MAIGELSAGGVIIGGMIGQRGPQGVKGDPAMINGYNTIEIQSGSNISVVQNGDVLLINNTYDDSNILSDINNLNSSKANTSDLSNVATSGSYNDLSNKPNIPTSTNELENNSGFITNSVSNLINYTKTGDMNTAINNAVSGEKNLRETADTNLQSQIDAITSSTDVVDVLSTYSDLEDYDTSKLTDKDVIKVMQDNTHSNALSYYRWVISGGVGNWNYVGSEGPFYTKSETDSLLNSKQDTIDNSHKLSADFVDDTNTTNKFVTSNDKTNWNGKEDSSNKVNSLSSENTNLQYPSAKAVYDELSTIKSILDENDIEETEKWIKGWFAITTNDSHHGCEWYPFSTSNTTSVDRLYDSIGLSITCATNSVVQVDNLPEQFKSFSCNFFVDNDGVKHITALKGMPNYGETKNTIKNVIYKGVTYKQDLGRVRRTRYQKFGINSNSKFEYDFYWIPKDGYVPTQMSINKDGSISPFYVIASCVAGLDDDGQLRSLKGLRPVHYLSGTTTGTEDISTNISYSDCISLFHNRGQYYSAGLMCEYMDILLDFYLKFGTRDTQSIMKGNTSNNYQYAVSYGESNVNRVVLTTDQANNIDLLSCVSVGDRGTSTSSDRNLKLLHNIVNDARVISKEIIDENHTALILDHAPFTTTETTFVSTMHEVSGYSDYVLGDYGSPISNTNGKHGMVFDGIEIAVGGYEVAGNAIMNVADSTGKREIYITNDVSKLSSTYSTIQSTYNKSNLAIQPTTLNAWNYITKMEADLTNGLFVPTECGQSGSGSSVGFADGCYIDSGTSGQREFLWLGGLAINASAGLSCLFAYAGISHANWGILARLSINGVGGELS